MSAWRRREPCANVGIALGEFPPHRDCPVPQLTVVLCGTGMAPWDRGMAEGAEWGWGVGQAKVGEGPHLVPESSPEAV